jgi:hypothetical protein
MLIELLTGDPPWKSECNPEQAKDRIFNTDMNTQFPDEISEVC